MIIQVNIDNTFLCLRIMLLPRVLLFPWKLNALHIHLQIDFNLGNNFLKRIIKRKEKNMFALIGHFTSHFYANEFGNPTSPFNVISED